MKFSTFTYVVEVNLQPKDFLTSFSNCYWNIFMYFLHFEMYINSLNVEYEIKS